jgi:DNA invertase Pin-like site-specific DNA recombinase
MEKYVAYYRVSTNKQGVSGYGIDAQREMVRGFLNGDGVDLVREFVEVDSGKNDDRVELEKAIRLCKVMKAKLVVSKLDRLSRDVAFIATLMKSDIRFVVAEMPDMNELTCHIFSAMGQHERQMISDRTKAGLAQAKNRGIVLGNPCFGRGEQIARSGDTSKALETKNKKCSEFRDMMKGIIQDIIKEHDGVKLSLQGLADVLNERGFQTIRGKQFTKMTVKGILG